MIKNGGRIKKLEDRKYFNFSFFLLVESEKSEEIEKMSLYKFTHILLFKKWCSIKTKKWPKKKKKSNHPNLLKNKNHIWKQNHVLLKKNK